MTGINQKAIDYKWQNVQQQLRNQEITFLHILSASDGIIEKIELKSYIGNTDTMSDSLEIFYHDTKKRRQTTLKKLGITQDDLDNGNDMPDFCKNISDYFIMHNGPIVADKPTSKIKAINKLIEENHFKQIENKVFDIRNMLKSCGETYKGDGSIRSLRSLLHTCFEKYKRLEKIEQNKQDCVVHYAYYWENEKRSDMVWLICNTSLGLIYFDVIHGVWGMTKKEQKKHGLLIEHFDTEDVERQLKQKYHVSDMKELEIKLILLKKEREEQEKRESRIAV